MKTFSYLLALGCLLSTAHAQTANQRAATYQGPKVVKDSKALGKKMVQKSKPADGILTWMSVPPVKK